MITLIKYILMFFYEQIKDAFIEIVRLKELDIEAVGITSDDLSALMTKANVHGVLVILSTAVCVVTVGYLFIYGFYDEIEVETEEDTLKVRKFRVMAFALVIVSVVIDIISKVV